MHLIVIGNAAIRLNASENDGFHTNIGRFCLFFYTPSHPTFTPEIVGMHLECNHTTIIFNDPENYGLDTNIGCFNNFYMSPSCHFQS